MCGIVGVIGVDPSQILFDGLKQLQNRGYDSAGICCMNHSEMIIHKYASDRQTSALDKLETKLDTFHGCHNGIAHTRWATHGPKTDENSHPHLSMRGYFALVHNGIIENYKELKQMLLDAGYVFQSLTDTEIIVNLLEYIYLQNKSDVMTVISTTMEYLQGTWGLAILCRDTPNTLYCTRHGSPLLISSNDSYAMIASEQSGFCNRTTNYFVLHNDDICIIEYQDKTINITTQQTYELKKLTQSQYALTPDPYPYWTLREIHEQQESSLRAISLGGRLISDNEVKLGGLDDNKEILMGLDNLILLACGTSYHAGMLGVQYFKDLCHFNTVQLFDGADFNKNDIPRHGKTALILMSQSGETKDLHRCLVIGKDNDLFTIGVVNVVDSLIAREVNCGCYLNAGREVGVAATKSFTSQVIILSMIAIWFAQNKKINYTKRIDYIKDLHNLNLDIKRAITISKQGMPHLLSIFSGPSCFLLGKGKSDAIAKEGALKIKEISYLHAEGYSSSSLKHGPFALLDNGFPVILISPNDEHYVKNENIYEEIKSRHATVIFITDNQKCIHSNSIILPKNNTYADLLAVIPLQYLAYHLAIERHINPDMPKNLAKVVTVD